MTTEYWIEPINHRVLVEPDIPPSKVGEIHLPENIERPASAGTIVAVSHDVHPAFSPGRSVLFMHYAGRGYTIDGKEMRLLATSEILALRWKSTNWIESHPSSLLVRRDEAPIEFGRGLILPESARTTKSIMATVMAVGYELRFDYERGDRVMLSAGVGRRITIDGERLYSCSPVEVVARVLPGHKILKTGDLGESIEGRYKEEIQALVYDRDDDLVDPGAVVEAD